MTTSKTKYSPAMVAAISAMAEVKGFMDAASCFDVLKDPAFAGSEITQRGVIAKVRSMGIPYEKAEKVTKAGEPVATKESLVVAIEHALGVTGLASLAKAEKKALRALLSAVGSSEAVAA
jgi:hypothetical protein